MNCRQFIHRTSTGFGAFAFSAPAAAFAAYRAGTSVVLLEHGTHIGGMMASGLGRTDVGDKRTIGGLSGEVFKRISAKYGVAKVPHNIRRVLTPDGSVLNEGGIEVWLNGPYEIPFRSLAPKAVECGNLLVPLCMSASYVAYCSIRMEPVYMMMGQASGAAAALTSKSGRAVQSLPYADLKTTLAAQGQSVLKLPPTAPSTRKQ